MGWHEKASCLESISVTPGTAARQAPLTLQGRTLEWVTMPSSRGSSQSRDWTQASHTAGGFFTVWAAREAHLAWCLPYNPSDCKRWPQPVYAGATPAGPGRPTVHISSPISVQWSHVSCLKSATVGIFTPEKQANSDKSACNSRYSLSLNLCDLDEGGQALPQTENNCWGTQAASGPFCPQRAKQADPTKGWVSSSRCSTASDF